MESSMQIALGDRVCVAARMLRGLFKQAAPSDILGVVRMSESVSS